MKRLALCAAPVALCFLGCGTEAGVPKTQPKDRSDTALAFTAADETPGFFRELYRLLSAQALLDDATAVDRLLIELPSRLDNPGDLPSLTATEEATRQGLLVLAFRSLQATAQNSSQARAVAESVLRRNLGLDPARRAWNLNHPLATVETTLGSAQTVATSTLSTLDLIIELAPLSCGSAAVGASWVPGEPQDVWVPEVCASTTYVDGYCESDTWVDGQCSDIWVADSCGGGTWRDDGYYQTQCNADNTCQYVWIPRWHYIDGRCSSGHYEQDCTNGYNEPGLCYEGHWQTGQCTAAHWQQQYPTGSWSEAAAMTPPECNVVRPLQFAIALTGVEALAGPLAQELDTSWQSALQQLLNSGTLDSPSEAAFDALLQILHAAS